MSKIETEIEMLLRNNVLVVKKNGTLRVYMDFRDLNVVSPKDKYQMPVAEILVNLAAGFEYLSLLYDYSRYN